MQRPTRTVRLTDAAVPPPTDAPSETEEVLPASFADWLAQPSHTITAGPEQDQERLVGLPGEFHLIPPAHGDFPRLE
jgi:hypothetical protein